MIINTMIYRIMEKPTTIFEFFNLKKNASNSKSTTKFQDNLVDDFLMEYLILYINGEIISKFFSTQSFIDR